MSRAPPTVWGHMTRTELHDQMGRRSRQTVAPCDPKWDNPCLGLQDSSAQNQAQMCHAHGGSPVGAGQHQHPALVLKDSAAASTKFE